MSLQIWLPLISDIHNQGLVDSKFSLVSGGTLSFGEGKFGTCLTNGQITATNQNLVTSLTTTNKFSYTFWVKPYATANTWLMTIGGGTGNTRGIWWNASTYRLQWAYSGSGVSFSTTSTAPIDEWTHVGITVDGASVKCYINGNFISSITSTKTDAITTNGTINVFGNNGYFNDVRIYDEILSPLQIKQISQGLVAHYLLDNNGGLPNLLNKTPKFYGSGGYNAYQLNLSKNLEEGKTYTIQFWDVNVSHSAKTADALGISVYWGGGNIALKHLIGTNYFTNGHADYLTATFTITSSQANHANAINAWLNIYNSFPNADGTRFMSIGDWKIEENSEPTAWTFNADDTNKNVEYDVSGYCHNGVKYNITDYSTNTPRYSISTVFNGSNSYVNIGRSGMVTDAITVNMWAYMDDWTAFNTRLISCTESGGWNFEPSSSKIRFAIGTGANSNTYKNTSGYTLADLSSGWHMFTGIYDGFSTKQYVDGVLNTSNNAYTTKTPIHYHVSNSIIIGAEATASGVSSPYFNGRISDVRIYATALSDADVLALYKNSAYIDSSGNVFASEYKEG